MTSCKGI